MAFVLLLREPSQNWCSAFGLFKNAEAAQEYAKNIPSDRYQYRIDKATDHELEQALDYKANNNRSFVNPEFLGTRPLRF